MAESDIMNDNIVHLTNESSDIINNDTINLTNESNMDKDDNQENETNYIDILDTLSDEYIIGIDLGTTNTCVGIWRNNRLEVIPDEHGNRTIPSFVAYTNINRYIGHSAKNQKDLNPLNVFYEVKRLIGRKMDDPLIKNESEFFSYNIRGDDNNNIILIPDLNEKKILTPEEISAAILTKVKLMASKYLKTKVTKCIITIPAYFNDGQRQATKDAATIAGLECIRIINEPTSAALAYGLLRTDKKDDIAKTIIVYDFGGGTLDVSLMRIEDGIFEVLSSCGNTRMGGSDFDNRLMSYCICKFKKNNGIVDLNKLSNLSLQKLRLNCEQAKKILSTTMRTHIAVKGFYDNKDLFISISRDEFEKICMDLFLICIKPVDDVLKNCDIDICNIDEIIMVGGMTKMPKIRELVKVKFNKDPNCNINPDEVVAAGAAIQGFLLSHRGDPFSESITLLDTTSLSLGVETVGGIMDIIIERGNVIPTTECKTYSTDKDYVESVIIKIFEGERKMTKDNFFVGEFELHGFDPQPRGVAEIEVSFGVDHNGIITVSAENKKNNEKSSIIVSSNKGRLTQSQIEELIEESKNLEIRDALERRKKMMYYEIEDFCSNILTNIDNKEFILSEKDRQIIAEDIKKITEWMKEKNYDDREDEEYEKVIDSMKHQYGVLILTGKLEKTDVKDNDVDNNGNVTQSTTIYGNDEDNDEKNINNIFEKIENEELGCQGLSDPEKAELKELRQAVSDSCYSIFEIISSGNTNISDEHLKELRDYIDDSLLWLHVYDKPSKIEYKIKIDEINETCDKIFNHYTNQEMEKNNIFKQNELIQSSKNARDELENLCYVLKLLIDDGAFPIDNMYLNPFEKYIDEILEWIIKNDNINNSETNECKDNEKYYDECKLKFDELNNYCNNIHQKMQGINLSNKTVHDNVVLTGYVEENIKNENSEIKMETDIISLMRKRQQNIFNEMVNDVDVGISDDQE